MPDLFTHQPHLQSRWASFENPAAAPSAGATTNQGRKGAAFSRIAAGETKTLLDIRGAGTIRRIWATISPRTPKILRSVVLEIFWDDAATPAVSAPLGDFFCQPLGRLYSFENELFSNPEGKSLNCCIPMPFRKAARIILRNESDTPLSHIFYDVDLTLGDVHDDHALYFHAAFSRQTPPVGQDFTILPQLHGRGRFLGASLGVLSNPLYGDTWWGEGEVKVYLDGDTANPTLVGTGTEDYIGTAWGQGVYAHRYQGCLAADGKTRRYAFYRLHVPDPIFFHRACRATIQQIGGAPRTKVLALQDAGATLTPISMDTHTDFLRLIDAPRDLRAMTTDHWVNFLRQDDYSACAYYYLDTPAGVAPAIPDAAARSAGLDDPPGDSAL